MLTIREIADAAKTAAAEFPIKRMDLFGSYANGTSTDKSDVDLLVEFTQPITLITLCSLKLRMEELLGISVDVIHAPISEDSMIELDKVVALYAA